MFPAQVGSSQRALARGTTVSKGWCFWSWWPRPGCWWCPWPWRWHTPKIPTERIPIGIRSVGKYSGHQYHSHHCHHCSVPLSLFIKWLWSDELVLFSYTNWLEPSAHAECADYKSDQNFPRWPKSTSATIHASKLMISRNTCCSILKCRITV